MRTNAARRGKSIARYVVELVLNDAKGEASGQTLVLDSGEQRELLETVRLLPMRLRGDADVPALVAEIKRGIDANLDVWALGLVREGQFDAVRAVMAARFGEADAGHHVDRIKALVAATSSPLGAKSQVRSEPGSSSDQGSLF